jgi:Na+/proline symporter
MIVEDIIKPFWKHEIDEKQTLWLMRIFVFVVGPSRRSSQRGSRAYSGSCCSAITVYIGISATFIFGRVWKGVRKKRRFWSMLISGVCAGIWEFTGMSYKVAWATTGIIAVVASLVPFFLISLLDKWEGAMRCRRFPDSTF